MSVKRASTRVQDRPRRLGPDAWAFYLGMGPKRSYRAVAKQFGVALGTVTTTAKKERWQERLRKIDESARATTERKTLESIEQMNDRHLRALKAVHARAVEALRDLRIDTAFEAVRALAITIKQERLIRGESTANEKLDVRGRIDMLEADLRELSRENRVKLREILEAEANRRSEA